MKPKLNEIKSGVMLYLSIAEGLLRPSVASRGVIRHGVTNVRPSGQSGLRCAAIDHLASEVLLRGTVAARSLTRRSVAI